MATDAYIYLKSYSIPNSTLLIFPSGCYKFLMCYIIFYFFNLEKSLSPNIFREQRAEYVYT